MLAVSDANIAAQTAVLAAESLGIGSCYIGEVMEQYERLRQLLNLPEYVFPAAMDASYREKLFAYKTVNQSYKEWMKAFCDRKYNADFSKEITRSVDLYVKQFKQ